MPNWEYERWKAVNRAHQLRWRHRFGTFAPEARLDRPRKLTGAKRIHVGRRTDIKLGARLEVVPRTSQEPAAGSIHIGDFVTIEDYCHIGAVADMVIASGVLIGSFVTIIDHDHTIPGDRTTRPLDGPLVVAPVHICERAWLAEKVTVLKGVTIGSAAIVAANSVVTKDVAPGDVVGGIPARSLKR